MRAFSRRGCVDTRHLSEIESDPNRNTFEGAKEALAELGLAEYAATTFDLKAIRYICECVSARAAALAGAGVASLINKIGSRRVTVGMDGSVYKFHPLFAHRLRRTAARLVCDSIEFDLVLSEDGSGRGAALAAAVGGKRQRQSAL